MARVDRYQRRVVRQRSRNTKQRERASRSTGSRRENILDRLARNMQRQREWNRSSRERMFTGETQATRNRRQFEQHEKPEANITRASTQTSFQGFEGEGSDTQDVLDRAQEQYGGILSGSGRRGSVARSSLSAGQASMFQDALSSGAYQRLMSDSTSIGDINVRNELSRIGVDWESFSSGRDTRTVSKTTRGDVSSDKTVAGYEDIDLDAFTEYLENQANPFAVLRGEQGAVDAETARAAGAFQDEQARLDANGDPDGTVQPAPLPSLLSGISEPVTSQRSVKRV